MPTNLTTTANEKSTYIITASFTDDSGASVVPSSITWSLTDVNGTVINSREDVSVSIPAASIDIVLSGDDLALSDGNDVVRVLTIKAHYSSSMGANLPLNDSCRFIIKNLKAIT